MSVDANCKADPGLRILGGGLGFQYSFALSKVMCNKRITNVANISHDFNKINFRKAPFVTLRGNFYVQCTLV